MIFLQIDFFDPFYTAYVQVICFVKRKCLLQTNNKEKHPVQGFYKHDTCVHAQLCLTLCDPMDCSLPDSSFYGILQAWVLEWVVTFYSRGSSPKPRDWAGVSCDSCIGRQTLSPLRHQESNKEKEPEPCFTKTTQQTSIFERHIGFSIEFNYALSFSILGSCKTIFFFFKRKLCLPAVDADIFSQVCTFLKHRLV